MSVKSIFCSRFENGVLLEADFKQLEVVVLAYLSQDKVLIEEIKNNIDIHKSNAAMLYDKPISEVTKEERQLTKALTFEMTYGAGAAKLAKVHKIDKKLAQKFLDNFKMKYREVDKWHAKIVSNVNKTGKLTGPLNEIYKFNKRYYEPIGCETYNPSEIKNYPVQGFAAILVLSVLAKIFRKAIVNRDKFLLINTVHDSIMFDCKSLEIAEEVKKMVVNIVKNNLKFLPKCDIMGLNVPLEIEVKMGVSWSEMK